MKTRQEIEEQIKICREENKKAMFNTTSPSTDNAFYRGINWALQWVLDFQINTEEHEKDTTEGN